MDKCCKNCCDEYIEFEPGVLTPLKNPSCINPSCPCHQPQEQVKFTMQPNAVCTQCLLNKCICPERQSDGSWKSVPQEQVKPESQTGTYRIEIGDILADFENNQDEERAVRCLFDVVATEKRRQANEIVKMAEEMRCSQIGDKDAPETDQDRIRGKQHGYNSALDDIITLIKEKYLNPLD